MERYHMLFVLFLVTAILLWVLLTGMFFVLDIRRILCIKTGWAVKKRVMDVQARYQPDEIRFPLPEKRKTERLEITQDLPHPTSEEELFEVIETKMVMEKEMQAQWKRM
ncbi:MAG: hypothetical protein IJ801_02225 [Lachnospiraceae bacterium]|nr:hypothetical protein [Lachnospiraceae bacterium]